MIVLDLLWLLMLLAMDNVLLLRLTDILAVMASFGKNATKLFQLILIMIMII